MYVHSTYNIVYFVINFAPNCFLYTHLTQEEFPEYPELLLEAISLSRRVQDPLMEFCALFASPEEEIFSLKMHVLQVLFSCNIYSSNFL